jgi:hypothetical protein
MSTRRSPVEGRGGMPAPKKKPRPAWMPTHRHLYGEDGKLLPPEQRVYVHTHDEHGKRIKRTISAIRPKN